MQRYTMESHRSRLENHHHPYKHLLLSSLQPFIVSIHSAILLFSHQCLSHSLPHSFSFSSSYSSFLHFFPFSFPFLHLPHSPFFSPTRYHVNNSPFSGGRKPRKKDRGEDEQNLIILLSSWVRLQRGCPRAQKRLMLFPGFSWRTGRGQGAHLSSEMAFCSHVFL